MRKNKGLEHQSLRGFMIARAFLVKAKPFSLSKKMAPGEKRKKGWKTFRFPARLVSDDGARSFALRKCYFYTFQKITCFYAMFLCFRFHSVTSDTTSLLLRRVSFHM